jgi:N6-L-threonylcarbamoyladenine synthase
MKILSIETSCDETAVALLECSGDDTSADFHVLSHALISQIEIHREFGGVYPAVAKREHAKNLVPLLHGALEEAEMLNENTDREKISADTRTKIGELLSREADMAEAFLEFIDETERPEIDAIAVTYGPGLEPALWVGVNFAQALALAWNVPLVPVNHMEGHLMISLARINEGASETAPAALAAGASYADGSHLQISGVTLPVLALLISGGHTEIDLMENWLSYKLLGQTRDDAIGEAFDKVARMMNLPYPGGPEISVLAEKAREDTSGAYETSSDPTYQFTLPRPMIDTADFDFSFSGLKTAVLYMIRDTPALQPAPEGAIADTRAKEQLARAFEDAAADVLVAKVSRALEETQALVLAIGGGVSANAHIRRAFEKVIKEKFPYVDLRFPPAGLTGDNAIMIALAGYYHFLRNEFTDPGTLIANGNVALGKK